MMGASLRCSLLVAFVVLTLSFDSQAFTAVSGNGKGQRRAIRTPSTSFMCSIVRGRRTADTRSRGLSMSEMEEDYPSDTGDDRFSAGGEPRWQADPYPQLNVVAAATLY